MDFSDNDVENSPVKSSPKNGGNTATVPLKSSIKVRIYDYDSRNSRSVQHKKI